MQDELAEQSFRRFAWLIGGLALALALLPLLFATLSGPVGHQYIGFITNTDDHMVYSAWMHQARQGRLSFENLFAIDAQPGLTVHLYYWALGQIARVGGLIFAAHFGRLLFGAIFLVLLYRLVVRLNLSAFASKLAYALAVFGGGFGFLVWHTFGQAITLPQHAALGGLMGGRLPIDVWQPEAFTFASLLTNGLFMVSLCLILWTFLAVLEAQSAWKPVLGGAVAFGLLMNIHSYDALLVALVLVGFLAALVAGRTPGIGPWALRAAAIGAGAIPAALWFVHVLRSDSVFQARAATETFAPAFSQVIWGLGALVPLALFAALRRGSDPARAKLGVGLVALLFVVLVTVSLGQASGYLLSPPAWAAVFGVGLAACALLARREDPLWNLILAWAIIGSIAIYFPGLFQRKLAMGMAIPWGLLAGQGLALLLESKERQLRNLATGLATIVLCASSALWLVREQLLIQRNVSTTTMHPAYLSPDAQRVLAALDAVPGRKVVIAPPGIAFAEPDATGRTMPDSFLAPYVPDLNPLLAGFAGATAYAGHWSETPDYLKRRETATRLFLQQTSPEERAAILAAVKPDYLVIPAPDAFPQVPFADLRPLGEVTMDGSQFRLLKIRR
jgi:arabinosyltransferase C